MIYSHPLPLQDFGCGVGGPANRIGKAFRGMEIVGLNICEYQLKKARSYAERDGLDKVSFMKVCWLCCSCRVASLEKEH